VFRLAFRLTGDADLAREFTQDTFVRAFSQLARFRGDSALSTWLHRVTVTVVANAMRKVKRFREREAPLEDVHPFIGSDSGVDPVLRDRLHRAIDALPEIYRTTVIMHDIEGYTHTEIAARAGCRRPARNFAPRSATWHPESWNHEGRSIRSIDARRRAYVSQTTPARSRRHVDRDRA
jgi:RNA polymerase sigma factor (sigma-70 family)